MVGAPGYHRCRARATLAKEKEALDKNSAEIDPGEKQLI